MLSRKVRSEVANTYSNPYRLYMEIDNRASNERDGHVKVFVHTKLLVSYAPATPTGYPKTDSRLKVALPVKI
jgi:hypothetical protein